MDFHTSLDGSEFNDGLTPESAFATVQKGVDALGPGDRLLIASGTYVERVRITGLGDRRDEDERHGDRDPPARRRRHSRHRRRGQPSGRPDREPVP